MTGILAIAGIVALIVLLIWLFSGTSKRRDTDTTNVGNSWGYNPESRKKY